MADLVKKEKNALIDVGHHLLEIEAQILTLEAQKKDMRQFVFQGMKKNRLKSLKMDDGTSFVIREGNRKVVIKDQEKAEKYLDEMNCWKIDNGKLLKIFGHSLKVPPFFKIERGEETLAIMAPKSSLTD